MWIYSWTKCYSAKRVGLITARPLLVPTGSGLWLALERLLSMETCVGLTEATVTSFSILGLGLVFDASVDSRTLWWASETVSSSVEPLSTCCVLAGRRWRLLRRRVEPYCVCTSYGRGSGLLQLTIPGSHFLVLWSCMRTCSPVVRGLRSCAFLSW